MIADLEEVRQPSPTQRRRGGTTAWILQVVSGVLLVVLLGLHIVTQHFVVKGGLRDYAQVVSYLSNSVVLAAIVAMSQKLYAAVTAPRAVTP